jgi:hypothetical protein
MLPEALVVVESSIEAIVAPLVKTTTSFLDSSNADCNIGWKRQSRSFLFNNNNVAGLCAVLKCWRELHATLLRKSSQRKTKYRQTGSFADVLSSCDWLPPSSEF